MMRIGNHDITLDKEFYDNHGLYFHNMNPQDPAECLSLLTSSQTITYLNHTSATVRLKAKSGPNTQFTVFGSPYSPRHGRWAFYYDTPANPSALSDLPHLWEDIPLHADIVITHTPSRSHGDEIDERRAGGCEALRQALWRVRPRLAVCGHIHDGRGAERVMWDLSCRNIKYAEKSVTRWLDPGEGTGNRKLSIVDLTGKKSPSLANDGSHGSALEHSTRASSVSLENRDSMSSVTFQSHDSDPQSSQATAGLGGDPSSLRCDREALDGRMGRQETCIVNAAIMKSRYPHVGGKKFNKPIVVDLNLPVWEDDEAAIGNLDFATVSK
jgi:hypothetical protein